MIINLFIYLVGKLFDDDDEDDEEDEDDLNKKNNENLIASRSNDDSNKETTLTLRNNQMKNSNQQLDIQRSKPSDASINNDKNNAKNKELNSLTGRSAGKIDSIHDFNGNDDDDDVNPNHGNLNPNLNNKVNLDNDPQTPNFEEAIAPVIDESGAIHIHDGQGAYSLPKNTNSFFDQIDKRDQNNDKKQQKRKQRIVIKSLDKNNDNESEEELRSKDKYVPVIVLNRDDDNDDDDTISSNDGPLMTVKRFLRSNHLKRQTTRPPAATTRSSDGTTITGQLTPGHFQKQRLNQNAFVENWLMNRKLSIPISVISMMNNKDDQLKNGDKIYDEPPLIDPKNLQFRGFVTTMNSSSGRVISIPIFRDKRTGGSFMNPNNRYFNGKRVCLFVVVLFVLFYLLLFCLLLPFTNSSD